MIFVILVVAFVMVVFIFALIGSDMDLKERRSVCHEYVTCEKYNCLAGITTTTTARNDYRLQYQNCLLAELVARE